MALHRKRFGPSPAIHTFGKEDKMSVTRVLTKKGTLGARTDSWAFFDLTIHNSVPSLHSPQFCNIYEKQNSISLFYQKVKKKQNQNWGIMRFLIYFFSALFFCHLLVITLTKDSSELRMSASSGRAIIFSCLLALTHYFFRWK